MGYITINIYKITLAYNIIITYICIESNNQSQTTEDIMRLSTLRKLNLSEPTESIVWYAAHIVGILLKGLAIIATSATAGIIIHYIF